MSRISIPPSNRCVSVESLSSIDDMEKRERWALLAEDGDVRPDPVSTLIVPGWRDSPDGHWQSLWAQRLPGAVRVQQQDWQQPRKEPWVAAVVQAIESAPHPVVVAAHSLGCIAAVHAARQVIERIAGMLLVAPADPERRALFCDFTPVPAEVLPFPSIVAASSNDPFCPIRTAGAYAKSWGSTFVRVPDAGHINVDSGHGEWPLGWALLDMLLRTAQPSRKAAVV